MDSLRNYRNSSSEDTESDNDDHVAHLKPVDTSYSVAKTLTVVAAPAVVPMVSISGTFAN